MKTSGPEERIALRRYPELHNLEVMQASYVNHCFARHSHEGFAVGVIERGALSFRYRGEEVVAAAGDINLANPDEPHTGQAAGAEGWTYRMFYFDATLLARAAREMSGRETASLPFFQAGVLVDPPLAAEIAGLHRLFSNPAGGGRLARESCLLAVLTALIRRHSDGLLKIAGTGRERAAVARAREFMEAHFAEDISLDRLSAVANLSPFHFIRVFARETGLSPHRFLSQLRVRRARKMIEQGMALADTAYAAGFADQSHLTRHFKSIWGITPGKYRNFIQDR